MITEHSGRVFDYAHKPHPKMAAFSADDITEDSMTAEDAKVMLRGRKFHYAGAPYLDQQAEGACVGFGAAHILNAGPITAWPALTKEEARHLYLWAQMFDEWYGEAYEGTSVNGVLTVLHRMGFIGPFRWINSAEQLRLRVYLRQPILAGMRWYRDMMEPDEFGYIHPTGPSVGGHCVAIVGYDAHKRRYQIKNSWGRGWGLGGRAWIHEDEMHDSALQSDAEFGLIEEFKLKSRPVIPHPKAA